MDYKKVTLKNVIDGRAQDMNSNLVDMSDEDRKYYFEIFREFLLNTCRRGSETYRDINTVDYWQIENCGIFRRLVWTEKHGAEYVVGQNYTDEINEVKRLITQ